MQVLTIGMALLEELDAIAADDVFAETKEEAMEQVFEVIYKYIKDSKEIHQHLKRSQADAINTETSDKVDP